MVTESRHQAKITLGGKGLSALSIYTESNRRISTHKLNPEEMEQQLTVILPSRMNTYHAEIIDATGKKYRRAL